eukprot:365209-Chlamydomonas_euryale.AAC.5
MYEVHTGQRLCCGCELPRKQLHCQPCMWPATGTPLATHLLPAVAPCCQRHHPVRPQMRWPQLPPYLPLSATPQPHPAHDTDRCPTWTARLPW